MLRYQRLILDTLDPGGDQPKVRLTDLAKKIGLPLTSLFNYANYPTFPHINNIVKLAEYYNESLSSILSEDDDLTVKLVAKVRALPDEQKSQLLQSL